VQKSDLFTKMAFFADFHFNTHPRLPLKKVNAGQASINLDFYSALSNSIKKLTKSTFQFHSEKRSKNDISS